MTPAPSGGSRWRSACGCTGCLGILLVCVLFGGFGITLTTWTDSIGPSPLLQATGVIARGVIGSAPPSTELPEHITMADSPDLSPEEAAYLNVFDWDSSWMNQSETRLRYLRFFSSWWSSRWKSQLAAEAQGWRQLYAGAQQLTPPEGYDAFHTNFLAGFQEYSAAADDIDQFSETGDRRAFDESHAAMQRGDALLAEAQQIWFDGDTKPEPKGLNAAMNAGLLSIDDLPSGWTNSSIPSGYAEAGPELPCSDETMFWPEDIFGNAAARYTMAADHDPSLQEVVALVGENQAEGGMLTAKIDFPCEPETDEDGYSYHVAPLDVPLIGDDTIGYQFTVNDEDGRADTIANVILIRQGGLVIEVWHDQTGVAPSVDVTEKFARAALERAKSIPQDQFPVPSDPNNRIQADAPTRVRGRHGWVGG